MRQHVLGKGHHRVYGGKHKGEEYFPVSVNDEYYEDYFARTTPYERNQYIITDNMRAPQNEYAQFKSVLALIDSFKESYPTATFPNKKRDELCAGLNFTGKKFSMANQLLNGYPSQDGPFVEPRMDLWNNDIVTGNKSIHWAWKAQKDDHKAELDTEERPRTTEHDNIMTNDIVYKGLSIIQEHMQDFMTKTDERLVVQLGPLFTKTCISQNIHEYACGVFKTILNNEYNYEYSLDEGSHFDLNSKHGPDIEIKATQGTGDITSSSKREGYCLLIGANKGMDRWYCEWYYIGKNVWSGGGSGRKASLKKKELVHNPNAVLLKSFSGKLEVDGDKIKMQMDPVYFK